MCVCISAGFFLLSSIFSFDLLNNFRSSIWSVVCLFVSQFYIGKQFFFADNVNSFRARSVNAVLHTYFELLDSGRLTKIVYSIQVHKIPHVDLVQFSVAINQPFSLSLTHSLSLIPFIHSFSHSVACLGRFFHFDSLFFPHVTLFVYVSSSEKWFFRWFICPNPFLILFYLHKMVIKKYKFAVACADCVSMHLVSVIVIVYVHLFTPFGCIVLL